jgi:hypothetical protein
MCAKPVAWEAAVEEFAGELTDVAYPVALKHGVKGSSVDVELDVWQALRRTLGSQQIRSALASGDEASAELTQAAYQVALRRGFSGSFVDVELDLWKALSLVS